ncbi:hypothetical protein VMCG_10265 [Cytospora schulzeri]|uniref:Uncharacterized protein n=1 Tax=Cytospora schulzeri TaxID=448051 RepID=A0A423VH63_9PEZI|nr:hypothetical protein VMCG_10265 [Valsa malicola]
MAAFSMISNDRPMLYGRSGYNSKPNSGDDDDKNQGRSGYNSKPNGGDDDEDSKNQGRSGYNSKPNGGGDDDDDNKRVGTGPLPLYTIYTPFPFAPMLEEDGSG